MNNVTEKELKKYYSEISKLIICDRKQKTAFLNELKNNISEYLSAFDTVTMEKIKSDFGMPDEIAKSFLDNCNNTVIKRKLSVKNTVLLFLVAVLIIYLMFVIISLVDVHTEAHGYFNEGIMMIKMLSGGGCL